MRTFVLCLCAMALFTPRPWAGDAVPVQNDLGADVRAFYGHARGHTPWPLTETVEAGHDAEIVREKLRVCRRLIVDIATDDGKGSSVFQFFTPYSLEDVETLLVANRKYSASDEATFPFLVTTIDGQRIGFAAGLTFSILTSHIEAGMKRETWNEYLNPLATDGPENRFRAVELATASWDIEDPGPVFSETERGAVVTELTLSTYLLVNLLPRILDDFDHSDVVPRLLTEENGKAVAFGKDALTEAPDAELDEADENSSFDDKRELLAKQIKTLLPELRGDGLRMVAIAMESSGMRYDIRLDPPAKKIFLRIKRK